MVVRLLKIKTPEFWGLALKKSSDELKKHILSHCSKNIADEINFVLKGQKRPLGDVIKAQSALLEEVKALIEKGEIHLDESGKDTYV